MNQTMTELDVKSILVHHSIDFTQESIFLKVGQTNSDAPYIYYVSLVPESLISFIENFITFAQRRVIPYKIVRTTEQIIKVLNGEYGIDTVGKIITLYFDYDTHQSIITDLSLLCKELIGPDIPNTIKVSECVYAKASNNRQIIPNTGGRVIQPITEFGIEYTNTKILRERPKGNIFSSDHYSDSGVKTKVIIKEGRRNMWRDTYGRDIVDRLKWEKTILAQLKKIINVPAVIDSFTLNQNYYLVLANIDGLTLSEYRRKLSVNYESFKYWSTENKNLMLEMLSMIVKELSNIHQLGFIHQDINSENFLVDNESKVVIIDAESICDVTNNLPNPPYFTGTIGFASQNVKNHGFPETQDHIYSIGKLLQYICTGINPAIFNLLHEQSIKEIIYNFTGDKRLVYLYEKCTINHTSIISHHELISDINEIIINPVPPVAKGNSFFRVVTVSAIERLIEDSLSNLDITRYLTAEIKDINYTKRAGCGKDLGYLNGISAAIVVKLDATEMNLRYRGDDQPPIIGKFITQQIEYLTGRINECSLGLNDGLYSLLLCMFQAIKSEILQLSEKEIQFYKVVCQVENVDTSYANGGSGMIEIYRIILKDDRFAGIQSYTLGKVHEHYNRLVKHFAQLEVATNTGDEIIETAMAILDISELIKSPFQDHITSKIEKMFLKLIEELSLEIGNSSISSDHGIYLKLVKYFSVAGAGQGDVLENFFKVLIKHLPLKMAQSNQSLLDGSAFFANLYLKGYIQTQSEGTRIRLINMIALYCDIFQHTDNGGYWMRPGNNSEFYGMLRGNSGVLKFLLEVIKANRAYPHLRILST